MYRSRFIETNTYFFECIFWYGFECLQKPIDFGVIEFLSTFDSTAMVPNSEQNTKISGLVNSDTSNTHQNWFEN